MTEIDGSIEEGSSPGATAARRSAPRVVVGGRRDLFPGEAAAFFDFLLDLPVASSSSLSLEGRRGRNRIAPYTTGQSEKSSMVSPSRRSPFNETGTTQGDE